MVLPRATPALLTRIVGAPSVARMDEAASAMADGEERSHLKKRTEGGAGRCQWGYIVEGQEVYPRT